MMTQAVKGKTTSGGPHAAAGRVFETPALNESKDIYKAN